MGISHPAFEVLSAYSDGELDEAQADATRRHLTDCPACRWEVSAFGIVESAILATPVVPCASARTLVSAALDHEILPEETPALAQHLAGCEDCGGQRATWASLDRLLMVLPAAFPPARVDAAIGRLVDRPQRTRIWSRPVVPLALRGLSVTALIAIVVALTVLSSGRAPQQAALPNDSTAIVASVQLSVLDTRTNTLYVLDQKTASLAALDASTNVEIARIAIGGRPTALALNPAENTVVVLDAQQKSLVSVDTTRNVKVSAVTVDMPGTPTSLQVGQSGTVVVSASEPQGGGKTSGVLAVVDQNKTVNVVSVDVAPRRLVLEPSGGRVLLVSATETTVADAHSFAALDKLPGGLGGAFSSTGDGGAILAAGTTGARVTFWGANAPAALDIAGTPLSIAALPDGGYGVLLSTGGATHIALVSAAGELQQSVDVAGAGTDLSFDSNAGRFAVIGATGGVAFAARPAATTAVKQPTQSTAPSTSAPTPTPTVSATPTSPAPTLVLVSAAPSSAPSIGGATQFSLPGGKQPFLARAAAGRIWFVDQNNRLNSLITSSRAVFTLAQLPNDTIIRGIAVSPNYVFAIDSQAGLTVFAIVGEQSSRQNLSFLSTNGAILTTSSDDRLWLVKPGGHEIFSFDPRTKQVQLIEVADASISALASDGSGRIWFANESRKSVGYYDTLTAKLVEFPVARRGSVSALLPLAGTLWLGTDAGELINVRGGEIALSASAGASVTSLVSGPGGAWYVASSGSGVVFAPLNGASAPQVAPNSARAVSFDGTGTAWVADPAAGLFYLIGTSVP